MPRRSPQSPTNYEKKRKNRGFFVLFLARGTFDPRTFWNFFVPTFARAIHLKALRRGSDSFATVQRPCLQESRSLKAVTLRCRLLGNSQLQPQVLVLKATGK
jgi:hypothetical protein